MPILQSGRDAYRLESFICFDSFFRCGAKRQFCLSHGLALRFGGREILAAGNRFSLRNLAGLVVYDDL